MAPAGTAPLALEQHRDQPAGPLAERCTPCSAVGRLELATVAHRCRAHRRSFRAAVRARAGGAAGAPLVLARCRVLDAAAGSYLPGLQDITISDGRILRICPSGAAPAEAQEQQQRQQQQQQQQLQQPVVLDVGGRVVMPGLLVRQSRDARA